MKRYYQIKKIVMLNKTFNFSREVMSKQHVNCKKTFKLSPLKIETFHHYWKSDSNNILLKLENFAFRFPTK